MKVKFFICFTIFTFLIVACQNGNEKGMNQDLEKEKADSTKLDSEMPTNRELNEVKTYQNKRFDFSLTYPDQWNVFERIAGDHITIINFYDDKTSPDLPIDIHSQASLSHVSIFPKGLATDLPHGGRTSLNQYQEKPPVDFELDREESNVFQLKNGNVWGYFLHPANPPSSWDEYGYVFAQIEVEDFNAVCYDKTTGNEISLKECDPMRGDEIIRSGKLNDSAGELVKNILNSISFNNNK